MVVRYTAPYADPVIIPAVALINGLGVGFLRRLDIGDALSDIFGNEFKTWSLQLQVSNVTDRTALYNFQSVFVGTRIVQPRTFALKVKRYF